MADGKCVERKLSPIEEQVNALNANVSRALMITGEITSKLSGVLSPAVPGAQGEAVEETGTPLVDVLALENARLRDFCGMLIELENRIQL